MKRAYLIAQYVGLMVVVSSSTMANQVFGILLIILGGLGYRRINKSLKGLLKREWAFLTLIVLFFSIHFYVSEKKRIWHLNYPEPKIVSAIEPDLSWIKKPLKIKFYFDNGWHQLSLPDGDKKLLNKGEFEFKLSPTGDRPILVHMDTNLKFREACGHIFFGSSDSWNEVYSNDCKYHVGKCARYIPAQYEQDYCVYSLYSDDKERKPFIKIIPVNPESSKGEYYKRPNFYGEDWSMDNRFFIFSFGEKLYIYDLEKEKVGYLASGYWATFIE